MPIRNQIRNALMAVAGIGLVGCSGGSPESGGTRTSVVLDQSGTHVSVERVSLAELQAEADALDRPEPEMNSNGEIGVIRSAIQKGPCTPSSLHLWDTPKGVPVVNVICFSGTGSVNLADFSRGTSNWASAVRSLSAGTGSTANPGLLSHSVCAAVDCPAQSFVPNSTPHRIDADAAGMSADRVSLYRLKRAIDTWDSDPVVHQFAIADAVLEPTNDCDPSCPNVIAKAKTRDFVWSGDMHTASWNVGNPATIVGHYMPFNGLDSGELPRCTPGATNDCNAVPGYNCVPIAADPGNRRTQYWAGENVCSPQGAPGRACDSNADCGPTSCVCSYASDGAGGCLVDPANPTAAPGFCAGGCAKDADCGPGLCSCRLGRTPGNDCVPSDDPLQPAGTCYMGAHANHLAELHFWRLHHPEWILYRAPSGSACDPTHPPDPNDVDAVAWFGDATQLPLDFTSETAMEEMVRRVRSWWNFNGPTYSATYSALSLDVVFPANYYGVCGVFRGGQWTPLFAANQAYDPIACATEGGYCDPLWRDAVVTALTRWRDEMHQDGMRVIANLGYSGSVVPYYPIPPTDTTLQKIFGIVDGVLDEGGFSGVTRQPPATTDPNGACIPSESCSSWAFDGPHTCAAQARVALDLTSWSDFAARSPNGYLREVQALGRPYFNKNAFGLSAGETDLGPSMIEWALASHLIAKGHRVAIYLNPNRSGGDDGATEDYPQLAVPIGHPCGPGYKPKGNTRARLFSHGLVVANAGDSCSPTVTWPLPSGHAFYRWSGSDAFSGSYSAAAGASVSVPYQTGAVLYTPDLLCP